MADSLNGYNLFSQNTFHLKENLAPVLSCLAMCCIRRVFEILLEKVLVNYGASALFMYSACILLLLLTPNQHHKFVIPVRLFERVLCKKKAAMTNQSFISAQFQNSCCAPFPTIGLLLVRILGFFFRMSDQRLPL